MSEKLQQLPCGVTRPAYTYKCNVFILRLACTSTELKNEKKKMKKKRKKEKKTKSRISKLHKMTMHRRRQLLRLIGQESVPLSAKHYGSTWSVRPSTLGVIPCSRDRAFAPGARNTPLDPSRTRHRCRVRGRSPTPPNPPETRSWPCTGG